MIETLGHESAQPKPQPLKLPFCGLALMGKHRPHEPKTRFLDLRQCVILFFVGFLVLRLQALDKLFEIFLCLLHLVLLLFGSRLEVRSWHRQKLVDLLLLRVVAQVEIGWTTSRAKILLRKSLQVFQRSATLVVLHVVWVSVLNSWVSPNTDRVAQFLATSGAINICDQNAVVACVLLHQLVPIGLHTFAVASPRGKKFYEDALAGCLLVPILHRQLSRCDTGSKSCDRQR